MKKILTILVIAVLLVSTLAGCNKAPVEKDLSLSIGVVVTESLAKAKLTESVAAIVTDAEGKIVLCRIDCVEYTAKFDEGGALDTTSPISKVAAGDSYGAMPAGTWEAQAKALENYVTGKTQSEVSAIALDGGVATDADLKASCSVNITDVLAAIDNAFKSDKKISFKASTDALTAGLSVVSSVKNTSVELLTQPERNAKFSTTFSAAILTDGKVAAAILDSADAELLFITENGASSLTFAGTKRALGEDYGVMPAGTWFAQADAYAAAAVGKTASDIATLASEGVAGCTINAIDFKAAIENAVKSAR